MTGFLVCPAAGLRLSAMAANSAIVVVLCLVCFALGATALGLYNRHRDFGRRQYDQRFKSVFETPDFEELDRIVEQDHQSFFESMGDWRNWGRGGRYHPFTHAM